MTCPTDLRIRNGSFYSGPGDYTLFVLDGDMLHPRQVRLGECNYDYIEVISGLEQGEQVVVSAVCPTTASHDMGRYLRAETIYSSMSVLLILRLQRYE